MWTLPESLPHARFGAQILAAVYPRSELRMDDPANAERVPGRVRIDLVVVDRVGHLLCRFKQCASERHDFVVSHFDVVHPKIEMDLLLRPVRPIRWGMVRRKLDPENGLVFHEHHVPAVVDLDCAVEYRPTEPALGSQVG